MRSPIIKTVAAVALAVAGLSMFTLVVLAVHDLGLFELDRNAQDPGGAPVPDDWATLYGGGGSAQEFTAVLPDIGADGGTQFQGGGSKDDLDITQWLWKLGEPLDKDDITNAYSAAYLNTVDTGNNNVGDLILYFGLDRFSANGSAQVGFWFLQDPNFGLTSIPQSGGFKFSGVHMDNDILVQSNFSGGGVIDRITVYKWLAGALVPVLTAADCVGPPASPADDAACATVNRSPQTSPWPYTPKANEGSPGTFLTGAFFEGGINISRLVPDAGCFTGFVAETRTSTPFDARLKDFVRGSLELCSANIRIEADDTNEVNDEHTFTVTVNKVIAGVSTLATVGNVDVTLTGSNGAVPVLDAGASSCDDGQPNGDNLDASGQCIVVFTSNSTGQVTGHAAVTVDILGDDFFVETDGVSPNSGDAVKTYVDAKIEIEADDTNEVGDSHTFTVTVMKDEGDGSGFVAATPGDVDFTLTNSNGAAYVLNAGSSTCDDAGDNLNGSGQCTIVFTSNSAGQVTGHASVSLTVDGVLLSRNTDGVAPNSDDAVKTYVDAKITIDPDDTNEVGDPHTFTVTVMKDEGDGSGFEAATVGNVDVTRTDTNGAASVLNAGLSTCDDFQPSGDNLDASGQCIVVFTSNSAGQVAGHAAVSLSVGGVALLRNTDGVSPNSDDAVKTFVDAKITIDPDETNEVGDPHTFTVDVEKDDGLSAAQGGDGVSGFAAATVGNVDVTLTDSNGAVSALNAAASTCDDNQPIGDNLDASGQCIVVFTSNSAGQVTGHATVSLSVGGVALTRNTDGVAPNSGDAVKTFVDAKITIDPDETNEVGDPHTFTVDVDKDDGLSAAQGGDGVSGFAAATVGNVDVTLTDSNGAVSALNAAASTCDDNQPIGDNLNGSGQCIVVFTSNSAGQVTGHATVSLSVGGVALLPNTDGVSPNSGDAVKTYVDAYITIEPDDTNNVTEEHTFTVTVKIADGSGGNFQNAPDNTPVTVTLTPAGGASALGVTDTCASPGTSSGTCSVTFHSDTAGTVTGHASVDITVSGLPLHRETDGNSPNSDDAVKTYVDGSLAWHKEDHLGNPLGGAAFEVCRTHTLDTSTDPDAMVDSSDDCFPVTDNSSPDGDPTDGEFLIEDLVLGRFTVRETSAPPGYTIDNPNAVTAPDMSLVLPDIEIETPFTNSPPLEGCTPGWWKNRGLGAWDGSTDALAEAVAAAVFAKWGNTIDGTTDSLFREAFDLTESQMSARGLDPDLTLLEAVEIGGGGFAALARQGTAALLNSLSVDYAYSAESVLQAVHDAFVSGDLGTLVDDFDTANNRDHSSCPTG